MESPSNRTVESKIKDFFKRTQLTFRINEGTGAFEFGAVGSLTPLKIFLLADEEANECDLIGFLPLIVDPDACPIASWFVRNVNSQIEQGEYILGRAGGVFFHVSREFSGQSSSWKDVKDLVDAAINHLNGLLPGLAAILSGSFLPEQALGMVLQVIGGEEAREEVEKSRLQGLNGVN